MGESLTAIKQTHQKFLRPNNVPGGQPLIVKENDPTLQRYMEARQGMIEFGKGVFNDWNMSLRVGVNFCRNSSTLRINIPICTIYKIYLLYSKSTITKDALRTDYFFCLGGNIARMIFADWGIGTNIFIKTLVLKSRRLSDHQFDPLMYVQIREEFHLAYKQTIHLQKMHPDLNMVFYNGFSILFCSSRSGSKKIIYGVCKSS